MSTILRELATNSSSVAIRAALLFIHIKCDTQKWIPCFPLFSLCTQSNFHFASCLRILYFLATILSIRARMVIVLGPPSYVCVHAFNLSHVYQQRCVRMCSAYMYNFVRVCKMKLIHFFQVVLFLRSLDSKQFEKSLFRKTVQHMRISYEFLRKLKSNRANRNAVVAAAAAASTSTITTTTITTAIAIVSSPSQPLLAARKKSGKTKFNKLLLCSCVCVNKLKERRKKSQNVRRAVTVAAAAASDIIFFTYAHTCMWIRTRAHAHAHAC